MAAAAPTREGTFKVELTLDPSVFKPLEEDGNHYALTFTAPANSFVFRTLEQKREEEEQKGELEEQVDTLVHTVSYFRGGSHQILDFQTFFLSELHKPGSPKPLTLQFNPPRDRPFQWGLDIQLKNKRSTNTLRNVCEWTWRDDPEQPHEGPLYLTLIKANEVFTIQTTRARP